MARSAGEWRRARIVVARRVDRHGHPNADAGAGPRADVELAVIVCDPFAHAEEPDAGERRGAAEASDLEADAVVGHGEDGVPVVDDELDVDATGAGVLRDVGERLLRDAIEHEL